MSHDSEQFHLDPANAHPSATGVPTCLNLRRGRLHAASIFTASNLDDASNFTASNSHIGSSFGAAFNFDADTNFTAFNSHVGSSFDDASNFTTIFSFTTSYFNVILLTTGSRFNSPKTRPSPHFVCLGDESWQVAIFEVGLVKFYFTGSKESNKLVSGVGEYGKPFSGQANALRETKFPAGGEGGRQTALELDKQMLLGYRSERSSAVRIFHFTTHVQQADGLSPDTGGYPDISRSPFTKVNRIPTGVAPKFSHVGIVPNDAAGQRVFSRFHRPCIPALLPTRVASLLTDSFTPNTDDISRGTQAATRLQKTSDSCPYQSREHLPASPISTRMVGAVQTETGSQCVRVAGEKGSGKGDASPKQSSSKPKTLSGVEEGRRRGCSQAGAICPVLSDQCHDRPTPTTDWEAKSSDDDCCHAPTVSVTPGSKASTPLQDKILIAYFRNHPLVLLKGQACLHRFSPFPAEKRGGYKGYTGTRYNRHIAAKRRPLNWLAMLRVNHLRFIMYVHMTLGVCVQPRSREKNVRLSDNELDYGMEIVVLAMDRSLSGTYARDDKSVSLVLCLVATTAWRGSAEECVFMCWSQSAVGAGSLSRRERLLIISHPLKGRGGGREDSRHPDRIVWAGSRRC
ncbi:hypothetical protein PR048_010119 [Dryococelus australis]|uniref:Uncharacterized protein n=1 Tax=Dryococelus australis TaxID=614101 RepID=A0ABQ9I1T6_9NEOP|nr:hypothetical protein PR048_010119 [Dryococelus australis]